MPAQTSLSRSWLEPVAAVTLVSATVGFLLAVSPAGVIIHADSVTYLDAAVRLAAGNGLDAYHNGSIRPLTHFPPFYPAVLAGLIRAGIPAEAAALWLNVICFALTVAILFRLLLRYGSLAVAVVFSAVFAFSPGVALLQMSALSESLFLLLASFVIAASARYDRSKEIRWLAVAAVCAGTAAVTRYAGIVLIPFVLLFALRSVVPPAERIRLSVAVVLLAAAPLALWLVRSALASGTAAIRSLRLAAPNFDALIEGVAVLGSWVVPIGPVAIQAALGATLLGGVCYHVTRHSARRENFLSWSAALLFLGYCGFLILARSTFDVLIDFDARMLAPGLLFLLVAMAPVSASTVGRRRLLAHTVAALLVAMTTLAAADVIAYSRTHIMGVRAPTYDRGAAARLLKDLPAEFRVYSNRPYSLYYHFGVAAEWLPCVVNNGGVAGIPECEAGLEELGERLSRDAALVLWLEGGTDDPAILHDVGRRLDHEVHRAGRGLLVLR